MKTTCILSCLTSVILGLIVLGTVELSSTETRLEEINKTVVCFGLYNNIRKDNCYQERTLPDESCLYNHFLPGWYSDSCVLSNSKDFFLVTSSRSYFLEVPVFHSNEFSVLLNPGIQLKVGSKGTHYDFLNPTDIVNWRGVGGHVFAYYLSIANSFGFSGISIGAYTRRNIV